MLGLELLAEGSGHGPELGSLELGADYVFRTWELRSKEFRTQVHIGIENHAQLQRETQS